RDDLHTRSEVAEYRADSGEQRTIAQWHGYRLEARTVEEFQRDGAGALCDRRFRAIFDEAQVVCFRMHPRCFLGGVEIVAGEMNIGPHAAQSLDFDRIGVASHEHDAGMATPARGACEAEPEIAG